MSENGGKEGEQKRTREGESKSDSELGYYMVATICRHQKPSSLFWKGLLWNQDSFSKESWLLRGVIGGGGRNTLVLLLQLSMVNTYTSTLNIRIYIYIYIHKHSRTRICTHTQPTNTTLAHINPSSRIDMIVFWWHSKGNLSLALSISKCPYRRTLNTNTHTRARAQIHTHTFSHSLSHTNTSGASSTESMGSLKLPL